jgi:hypothetical protein
MMGLATAACAASASNQAPQQTQLARAVATPERVSPAAPVPESARENLKVRMAYHASDMNALVANIMVLRYDEIRNGAARIASDASLTVPRATDATKVPLPDKFFAYQDNLRLEAKTLAKAADHHSAFDVADSFGRLSQICVRCHAVYRAPDAD